MSKVHFFYWVLRVFITWPTDKDGNEYFGPFTMPMLGCQAYNKKQGKYHTQSLHRVTCLRCLASSAYFNRKRAFLLRASLD